MTLVVFNWVLSRLAGFSWVFTGFYWVLLNCVASYQVLLGFVALYRVLVGFVGFYWVLLGFAGFYWVLMFVYRIGVEFVDEFLAFGAVGGAVEPEVGAVLLPALVGRPARYRALLQELLQQSQREQRLPNRSKKKKKRNETFKKPITTNETISLI